MTLREVIYFTLLVIPTIYFGILPSVVDNFLGDETITLLEVAQNLIVS
jgi:hypothetical protein